MTSLSLSEAVKGPDYTTSHVAPEKPYCPLKVALERGRLPLFQVDQRIGIALKKPQKAEGNLTTGAMPTGDDRNCSKAFKIRRPRVLLSGIQWRSSLLCDFRYKQAR